jgi:hypothetical protein
MGELYRNEVTLIGCRGVDWIYLEIESIQWLDLVNGFYKRQIISLLAE